MKTKIYAPHEHSFLTALTDEEVKAKLGEIANLRPSPGMLPIVPVSMILDYSGSMVSYKPQLEMILSETVNILSRVDNRMFVFELFVINDSEVKLVYFGDIKGVDAPKMLAALPEPSGMTPYAEALNNAYTLMSRVYDIGEEKGFWYNPCGVFLTVTDSLANDKDDFFEENITELLAKDAENGTRFLTEFVTQNNEEGLCPGGFKLFIDASTSEQDIRQFLRALCAGTSTVGTTKNADEVPRPRDREKRNRYLADRLIYEMETACLRWKY